MTISFKKLLRRKLNDADAAEDRVG
jgi:hypothetical protein